MKRPVDFAAALATARRVLQKPQEVPMTWLLGFFHLEDARDALGRPLDAAEEAEYRALAAATWTKAAEGCIAELEAALAIGDSEHNTVRRIVEVALVSVRQAAASAGTDWTAFEKRHRKTLARGRALLTRGSRTR